LAFGLIGAFFKNQTIDRCGNLVWEDLFWQIAQQMQELARSKEPVVLKDFGLQDVKREFNGN
jgi:hypothetical protein